MTDQRAIDEQLKVLRNQPDSDLLKIINEQHPYGPGRQAAEQILHERKNLQLKAQYGLDKSTNNMTKWILGLTILVVLLMVLQLITTN